MDSGERQTIFSADYKDPTVDAHNHVARKKNISQLHTTTDIPKAYGITGDGAPGIEERKWTNHVSYETGMHCPSDHSKKMSPKKDQFKTSCAETKDMLGHRKLYKCEKTSEIRGSDVLHQVDKTEGEKIISSTVVPNKAYRVSRYMDSSGMKQSLTGHEKDFGEIDPKSSLHGTGKPVAKDCWKPKAY